MRSHAKPVYRALLAWLIIMLPGTVRAQSPVPLFDEAKKLFVMIQDLELMRRNIEACYHAETRATRVEHAARLSWTNPEGLDRALVSRVFGHLARTPEYERFVRDYQTLIQRTYYEQLNAADLFAEYMRLLESGRIRFLTELKELQESSAEKCLAQAQEGSAESMRVKTVPSGHAEGSQSTGSGRAVPVIRLQVQITLNAFTPLAVGQKSVSRIVRLGMDPSGSASTAAPTTDLVELDILVAQERAVPPEEVSTGYHLGLVKGIRSGTRTNPKFSDAVDQGVVAWDQ